MEQILETMDALARDAQRDPALREQLLLASQEENGFSAFCRKCREAGYPVYEMDLIAAGEEFHAEMKRSTNGGGENSPMLDGQDDFYELFLAELRKD